MDMQEFIIQSEKLAQAIVLSKLKSNKYYRLEYFFKYIPEGAVLFLNDLDLKNYKKYFKHKHIGLYTDDNKDKETFIANDIKSLFLSILKLFQKNLKDKNIGLYGDNKNEETFIVNDKKLLTQGITEVKTKPVTIFLSIADSKTFIKANDIAKELKEKYGVAEVNVFALHCFVEHPPPAWAIVNQDSSFGRFDNKEQKMKNAWFDKLITTNSTKILKVESSERLQVIDCFF